MKQKDQSEHNGPCVSEFVEWVGLVMTAAQCSLDLALVCNVDDELEAWIAEYHDGPETPASLMPERIGIYYRIRDLTETVNRFSGRVAQLQLTVIRLMNELEHLRRYANLPSPYKGGLLPTDPVRN